MLKHVFSLVFAAAAAQAQTLPQIVEGTWTFHYANNYEFQLTMARTSNTSFTAAYGGTVVANGKMTSNSSGTLNLTLSWIYGSSNIPGSNLTYFGLLSSDGTRISGTYGISPSQSSGSWSASLTTSSTPRPEIAAGGIVPAGSTVSNIQAGEWVSIYGTNLASTTATWNGDFPVSLRGTSVTIDGKSAYLAFVSPGQVNLQVPDDTATGTVTVTVTTATGSTAQTVNLSTVAPSFLLLDGKHVAGIILRANGSGAYGGGTYDIVGPTGSSLGYSTVAARAGDTVELFGTGFGPTTPSVAAGRGFSGSAPTTNPVQLMIKGVGLTPSFAGLSGAGLVQINFIVPAGLGTGDVALAATVAGVTTQANVVMSVQ